MSMPALTGGRELTIHSADGTRLHAEIFGPADGYPIVLVHGITCAVEVWTNQITALAGEYRVIAYDHRGHGRSQTPSAPHSYSLNHLAADLDAVLDAALAPGERAVIAGHSMGGMAITAWSQRYPRRVADCADGVALINTSTGDVVRRLQLMTVPPRLAALRARVLTALLKTFGAAPMPAPAARANRKLVEYLAVGADAAPAVADMIYRLFEQTPAAGRGGWLRVLAEHVASTHIPLAGLTVPALVIGSKKDRLLPIAATRRIASDVPNLAALVELDGGHCSILERQEAVTSHLRALVESVARSKPAADAG